MRIFKVLVLSFVFFISSLGVYASAEESELFASLESKNDFAQEISFLITKAWKKWQDSVVINGVEVQGSRGLLMPGDIGEPVLTSASIMKNYDKVGKSQTELNFVKAIADAMEHGMRLWQRGYMHMNIPFPQGASCTYTMPPSNNVPVIIASGKSSGDKAMTEKALYNYMLYRAPKDDKGARIVFHALAKGISRCFDKWKSACSIIGIVASGGIAPQPAPIGTGPGPVRGAKGHGGKLVGPYFDGDLMRQTMIEYFESKR
jgi:hypothetical protein